MILEIACFEPESCRIAAENGADRIELCMDYASGGLTPAAATLEACKKAFDKEVVVMIRPRSGNFIYSDEELTTMKQQITELKTAGANGFVFGILNDNNQVDKARNSELLHWCSPLPCTFHRAFDMIEDKTQALEDLIQCGFRRLLNSGGPGSAIENLNTLKDLQLQCKGRIDLVAGGGVRASNISELIPYTGIREFHSAAVVNTKP